MSVPTKSLRVPALAVLLLVAACGAPSNTPDAGDTTPDAGGTTPDAGDVTPDAGDTTPDAGGEETPDAGSGAPFFKMRVLNLQDGQTAFGGIPPSAQNPTGTIFFNEVPARSVSGYVAIPVGTAAVTFGQTQFGVVNTSAYVEGDEVLAVVGSVQGTVAAVGGKEVRNTDANKRLLQVGTTVRSFGLNAEEAGTLDLGPQQTATKLFDADVTGFRYGGRSDEADYHFTLARIPLGGRGILIADLDGGFVLVPETGSRGLPIVPLLRDVQIRPVVLTGSPAPLDFKAVAPFGEVVFATGKNLVSTSTSFGWIPADATSLVAYNANETYTKTEPFGNEIQNGTGRFTLLVHGSPVELVVVGWSLEVSGGNSFALYGAEKNLRWRTTVMSASNQPTTWIPGANMHVEPRFAYDVGWGSTGGNFSLGFQLSNPPQAPSQNSVPEPVIQITGMDGWAEGYLFSWSQLRIMIVKNDGTISVFPPFPI